MMTQIGHYQVVSELGSGGMGVVYKAYDPLLDRYVAVKVLSIAYTNDAAIKARFLREARAMAALNDTHIVQIYAVGEQAGQPYFAMEFVEGESLSDYLDREGKITVQNALAILMQVTQGLMVAHEHGVIHRDLKPGNLLLNQRGQVKIADFGIAFSSADLMSKLTTTGEFVGTPGYLSPEVCTGTPVDERSDIFSLGIVFFEILTGDLPFTDDSPLGLMLKVVREDFPDVRDLNEEVDELIYKILMRMTEKDPQQRYANCHVLREDLHIHPLSQSVTLTQFNLMLSAPAKATIESPLLSGDVSATAVTSTLGDTVTSIHINNDLQLKSSKKQIYRVLPYGLSIGLIALVCLLVWLFPELFWNDAAQPVPPISVVVDDKEHMQLQTQSEAESELVTVTPSKSQQDTSSVSMQQQMASSKKNILQHEKSIPMDATESKAKQVEQFAAIEKVSIMAFGDPLITQNAEASVTTALKAQKIQIIEVPRGSLLGGSDVNGAFTRMGKNGAQALILIRTDGGLLARRMQRLKTDQVNLTLRAYSAGTRKVLYHGAEAIIVNQSQDMVKQVQKAIDAQMPALLDAFKNPSSK